MSTPTLDYLLSTYFHQDFRLENGGVWETVDAFLRENPHHREQLPREIDEVLLTCPTEEEVAAYVAGTGCAYWAAPAAGGYRGWLTEMAQRVEGAQH
jgi:hypothetical protein